MLRCRRTSRRLAAPWPLARAFCSAAPPHDGRLVASQKVGHKQLDFVALSDAKQLQLQSPPTVSPIKDVLRRAQHLPYYLEDLFLPRDYQTSTTHDYLPYAKWQFVGSVAGTACGVLSMQSLLYAIGLQSGAIPMAAALNWVIKDGLGQFGGVLFASLVNHRFDSDPKRWRVVSALAMDAATLTEILTPLCPAYFLPMAAMANVAKNISWLSASATRAGFHYSFAKTENLADITAKAGSQSIAHGGRNCDLADHWHDHVARAGAFFVLSSINLWSLYNSLRVVSLRTLNQQRLNHILDAFIATAAIPTPDTVSDQERFVSNLVSGKACHLQHSQLEVASRLDAVYTPSTVVWPSEKYLLHADVDATTAHATVHLLIEASATSQDVLAAHLHARLFQTLYEAAPGAPTVPMLHASYATASAQRRLFLQAMDASPWHCENLLVEETPARYTLHNQ
ncbi:hypothetical protein SPRG_20489 [Saprolegnia parasitica CBS 223.65]|uniref:Protein root UVB sensitive/RUS domain-containing protein n=1 Tax=Saprolegnia parasitica (strain CBS 223.65) TaxID=695850 RepID=A0A067C7I2_SAPPC|nr:hypothetical protein SPRG_20489 [Saprolegnia parasitica CBS 223.65]KDO26689.1 hypothetical protein SPRG_20489 [Saprolegnia parasitica CBS 223.65]|eukprot:XP_012202581.1 hypothetical protein SPRG_20489 [Saprolegnia parasitica CBS 223.65]